MKTFSKYIINEKLKLNTDTNIFKHKPKTKLELIEIIKSYVDEEIYDFNTIDVSEINDFEYVFARSYLKNINFKCGDWQVWQATSMASMFAGCEKFNDNLSNWKVNNVQNFSNMFADCESFEGNGIELWNISAATSMRSMFQSCKNLNVDFSNWQIPDTITSMANMFLNCKKLTFDFTKWNLSKSINKKRMFYGCKLNKIPKWYTIKDAY